MPMHRDEFEVDCLRSSSTFNQLENIWSTLERLDTQCTPFSTWSWLNSWWNAIGAVQGKLRIIIVRKGKEVVAIAPMIITAQKPMPLVTINTLSFMGDVSGLITPHYGIIAQPRFRKAAEELVIEFIPQMKGWQVLSIENLSASSSFAENLRNQQLSGTGIVFREQLGSIAQKTLPLSWAEYRQEGDVSRAAQLKALSQRLNELGHCEISITSTKEDFAIAQSAMSQLVKPVLIKKSKTTDASEKIDRFLNGMANSFFASDHLWQITIKIDSEIVGVQHYFLWRGYLILFQEAFTQALTERQISQFMLAYAIKRGFDTGVRRVCVAASSSQSIDQFVGEEWNLSDFRYTPSKLQRLVEPLIRT